jgi:hypothetical protein
MSSDFVSPATFSAALASVGTPMRFMGQVPEWQFGRLYLAKNSWDRHFGDWLNPNLSWLTLEATGPWWSFEGGVAYSTIPAQGIIVTGIRSDSSHSGSVVITGSAVSPSGETTSALYEGPLEAVAFAPSSSWKILQPVFAGETVTSSTFYGPNTARFDPSLGTGNIRAVGSYKYSEGASGPNADHGMIYQGPINGVGGTWTQIDASSLVSSGTLLNTIAHSTMGNLVVGNYDTSLTTGHAFIYNIAGSSWTELNPTGSLSVTAYGIWQNGGSGSTSYTIAGGFSDLNHGGVDEGYLVDYDSITHALAHLATFNFDNKPIASLISHFDGITATANGYNLTGDYVDLAHGGKLGAFFASVERLPDGSFSNADWTNIAFTSPSTPNVTLTSGNTVIGNNVLGIYVSDGTSSSYLATVLAREPNLSSLAH